jgi:hypothetical protein
MKGLKLNKWEPVKVKRKSDGKIILAVFHQWMYTSMMLWDGEHQWLVNPDKDEISVPTLEEIEIINTNINKWREQLMRPSKKQEETPKQDFKVTETKAEKPNKVVTILDVAKKALDKITETPKAEPKPLTDFELLTADIASV